MSISITLQNAVNERANSKKDGCYQYRGCAYRVRSGRVTHLAYAGEVLQQYGHFNVMVGKLEHYASDFALRFLKSIKD